MAALAGQGLGLTDIGGLTLAQAQALLDGQAVLRRAEDRRLLAVVRLAVNGTADDISLWQQMQDRRPGPRGAAVDDEAEFAASLRTLGFDLEDDDGQ